MHNEEGRVRAIVHQRYDQVEFIFRSSPSLKVTKVKECDLVENQRWRGKQ